MTSTVRDRYGWEFFYYGNVPGTFGMTGERGWYTYDHRPRFTTNYQGLRNRFGILSEVYSYATFEERILAHGRFVEAVIDFAWTNATRVREIATRADAAPAPGMEIALRAGMVRGDTIEVLMGAVDEEPNPYTGDVMYRRRDTRTPERMPDYGAFQAEETVAAPVAYLVPASLGNVIERLAAHGIETATLDRPASLPGAVFDVDSTWTAEREYQGHRLRRAWGSWREAQIDAEAGAIVVPVRQPLGRLIVLMLEPGSDDGFFSWNLLDEAMRETDEYPIVRIDELPVAWCSGCHRFH